MPVSQATPDTPHLSPMKQALLELRELRSRLADAEQRISEPVAIIGLGLRLPGGVDSPDAFWELLHTGRDAIIDVPASRWPADELYDADPARPGKMTTRAGGFLSLSEIDRFAPAFFGISPREAVTLDPQQRLLLEVSWEALERAGQSPERLFGSRTGVFIGISNSDYQRLLLADPARIDAYATTGTACSVAAGRLAYLLGSHGPAVAIDTACSSSLVAIHLAMRSLRNTESDLALAGGVNLILSPELSINFSKANMLAPDGRCKTFDAAADGYGRGEGCGIVVLKRLSDALRDHDSILAVLRGSAINQDGRSGGLTAPNGPAQEAVIRAALADARLEAAAIEYVETHGTGTPLGDPIEVRALSATLGQNRPAGQPLKLGSVKTNIGHLEAAAGVAGLAKVILALQHGELPAHLNLRTLNPFVGEALGEGSMEIVTTHQTWTATSDGRRRVAGVSSFGLSGTNAHVIVEEAPRAADDATEADPGSDRRVHVLALSAQSQVELAELAHRYADHLSAENAPPLADVAYTANTGRAHFAHRLAVQGSTLAQVVARLRAAVTDQPSSAAATPGQAETPGVVSGHNESGALGPIALLFTGQGALAPGAGRALYETQPTFRAAVERCDELLRPRLGRSIVDVLYPSIASNGDDLLKQMRFAQPALFTLQVALAELWKSWGIAPNVVLGHSAGEYAAAYVAGVLSLEDALDLVVARGRLLQMLPVAGEMVAVLADESRVTAAIAPYADRVGIAAVNGPHNVVISGEQRAVRSVQAELIGQGVECRVLDIPAAAHSPLVEPILERFERVAAGVQYRPPRIDFVSTVTGDVASAELQGAAYWRNHLRNTVRFEQAMQSLYASGARVFVEIGAHPTLLGMGRTCVPDEAHATWLPSLRQGRDDCEQMIESLSALYVRGATVDWVGFEHDVPHRRVVLPTYPWQRERYWFDGARQTPSPPAPALGSAERLSNVVSAAERQSNAGPLDLDIAGYPARWEIMDRLATAYMACAIRQLGLFSQPGEMHSIEEAIATAGVLPDYQRLVQRWLDHLVADGWLELHADGTYTARRALPMTIDPELDREATHALKDIPRLLGYLRTCGERLVGVLRGIESALDTLFPGGSYDTVEYLYDAWPVARYFNAIVRSAVESVASATAIAGRRLRVLEIGAGTGGTTASVLPCLPANRTSYTFTDVSDFFLARARQRFAEYPCVEYRLLDIEADLAEQDVSQHTFDVVIAANVMHATRDLGHALQQARSLLGPDGVLVLYEATRHPRWMDVTTGLIAGWQRFDDEWRQGHPLLDSASWRRALHANGFDAVYAFPSDTTPTAVLGQHVILARAQPTSVAPPPAEAEPPTPYEQTCASVVVSPTADAAPSETFAQRLADALPDERRDLLVDFVRDQTARVLRVEAAAKLGRERRLLDLGLDSLMAVELRNRLTTGLGLEQKLPATLVFDYPTISAIADYLAGVLFPAPVVSAEPPLDQPATSIAELSDPEVERLLLGLLGTLDER